jgi:serine/threonine protein phosphatase PrpC
MAYPLSPNTLENLIPAATSPSFVEDPAPAPASSISLVDSSVQKLWWEVEEKLGKYETEQLLSAFAQCSLANEDSKTLCRNALTQYLTGGKISIITPASYSLEKAADGFKIAMKSYILHSTKKIPSLTENISSDMASVMLRIAEARECVINKNFDGTTNKLVNALAGPVLQKVTLPELHCEAALRTPGNHEERITSWKTRSLDEEPKMQKNPRSRPVKIDSSETMLVTTTLVSTQVLSSSTQGERLEQEDAESNGFFDVQEEPVSYYSLFDGHGGSYVSKKLAVKAASFLKDSLNLLEKPLRQSSHKEIENVLTDVFVRAQEELHKTDKIFISTTGATASIALIFVDNEGPAVWTVQVGDSRIIAIKEGMAYQLTEDADPEVYEDGVESRGGSVLWDRVNGSLSVARSVGDTWYSGAISPKATVSRFPLSDTAPTTLIIACDGTFECATTQEVVDEYKKVISAGKKSPTDELIQFAYAQGSEDNISVKIVTIPEINKK